MEPAADQAVERLDHASKAALFDALAQVAEALATGRRAEIIDLLAQGERSVEEIASEIHQSTANASHHLRILARSGLVLSRRDGTRIHYRLSGPEVEDLWLAMRNLSEAVRDDLGRLAAAYLGDKTAIRVISRDELLQLSSNADVTVIDVRPGAEYRLGHVPGARSVPLASLGAAVETFPTERIVVAYCRGPYCAFAPAAVRALRRWGVDAAQLADGFPEWRRAGLPVEVGEGSGR